jgi:peptidoglycan/xylan/chitin deacetylase (PgdA/CDA1 family)
MTTAGLLYHFRNSLSNFLWKIRLFKSIYPIKKENAIIMYHGIDNSSSTEFNLRYCNAKDFRSQLKYLKHNYNVVSLKEMFDSQSSKSGKVKIAITMDDGFENWIKYAAPVINELKIPVTMFISRPDNENYLWLDAIDIYISKCKESFSFEKCFFEKVDQYNYVDKEKNVNLKKLLESKSNLKAFHQIKEKFESIISNNFKDTDSTYWKLLNEAQIVELAESPYISIGSHCLSHIPLTNLSREQIIQELSSSKKQLEKITGNEINSIAYPIGDYSPDIVNLAEEAGYKYQLAVSYLNEKDVKDQRILSRIGVYSDYPKAEQMRQFIMQLNSK